MLIAFLVIGLICSLGWWVVLGKPRYIPSADNREKSSFSFSIIIPARNEENNLGKLLDSIFEKNLNSGYDVDVIVVDDHSEDRTASLAAEKGARVISAQPLQEGWKGKPWACVQGAEAATGDWLLFLDADTWIEDGQLGNLLAIAKDAQVAHSVSPYHEVKERYEQFSAFFNVMMVAGSNNFSLAKDSENTMFGQSLLISKSMYQVVGGHEAVKDRVLENVYLSAELRKVGAKCENYLGKGTISMRMFPERFSDLWAGWKKGFVSGAGAVPKFSLIGSSVWITGGMISICAIPEAFMGFGSTSFLTLSIVLYLVYVVQCVRSFSMVGTFKWWTGMVFPVFLLFYQCLFLTAVIHAKRGVKTQWKGRDVS